MGEAKMTSILFTTSQFLATLAFPVKNKVEQHISKNVSYAQESVDAVIEVVPIVHKASKGQELAEKFYKVISQDASQDYMRTKRENLQDFIESCGQKVQAEIKESLSHVSLEQLLGKVETVIINLLDKSGEVVQSKRRHIEDIIWTLGQTKEKLLSLKQPRKLPSLLVQHETPPPPKPRRKERVKGQKEGSTKHRREFSRMAVH